MAETKNQCTGFFCKDNFSFCYLNRFKLDEKGVPNKNESEVWRICDKDACLGECITYDGDAHNCECKKNKNEVGRSELFGNIQVLIEKLKRFPSNGTSVKLRQELAYMCFGKEQVIFRNVTRFLYVNWNNEEIWHPVIPARFDFIGKNNDCNTVGDQYWSILVKLFRKSDQNVCECQKKQHWSRHVGIVTGEYVISSGDGIIFNIKGKVKLKRNLLGEMTGSIPVPSSEFIEDGFPLQNLVVTQLGTDKSRSINPSLKENLEKLNDILIKPGPYVAIVKGDPGSGKEFYANAIHYGSRLSYGAKIETRSIAGIGMDEFTKKLFSAPSMHYKCLIEDLGDGGTIILDEANKVNKDQCHDIYSSLLRVIEAKEYVKKIPIKGGGEQEELKNYKFINWIFSGTFDKKDRLAIPLDFKSRVNAKIEVENPVVQKFNGCKFLSGYLGISQEYVKSLFVYFYVLEVIDSLGRKDKENREIFGKKLKNLHYGRRDEDSKLLQQRYIGAVLLHKFNSSGYPCRAYEKIDISCGLYNISERFAKKLEVKQKQKSVTTSPLSIRHIREMTKDVFYFVEKNRMEEGMPESPEGEIMPDYELEKIIENFLRDSF